MHSHTTEQNTAEARVAPGELTEALRQATTGMVAAPLGADAPTPAKAA